MPSPCDPRHAPVGDVGGALLLVDSRLKAVHAGESEADPAERALTDQYVASLGPGGLDELVDG
ncbi:hypothetical protein GTW43_03700, partial [Streptomyces sp. SID5785]|nr:hypothetical protein [Streptomyces sp. SID5785]